MTSFIEAITQFIVDQGALGVFLASVVEEIIVPIPSTVIQTGAGFLFLSGMPFDVHSVWILFSRIVVPSALGTTLGSLMIYGLVYWGGEPMVRRFGKYFLMSPAKLQHAHDLVLRRKGLIWAFCILRFIPIIPNVLVAAVAGFVRLPLKTYLWTTLLGVAIRASYLGAAGWIAGNAYEAHDGTGSVSGMMMWFAIGVVAVMLVIGVIAAYARRKRLQ